MIGAARSLPIGASQQGICRWMAGIGRKGGERGAPATPLLTGNSLPSGRGARKVGGASRGVAQPGRAPALGAGSRQFESGRPDAFPNETFPGIGLFPGRVCLPSLIFRYNVPPCRWRPSG
jgi:hypothetical protein